MKKFVLLLLIGALFVGLERTIFAQESNAGNTITLNEDGLKVETNPTYVTNTDAEKLIDKYGAKAYEEIKALINGPGTKGYEIVVAKYRLQGFIYSVISPALIILLILINFFWWYLFKKAYREHYGSELNEQAGFVIPIVLMVVFFICFCVNMAWFPTALMWLNMPEYFALEKILMLF